MRTSSKVHTPRQRTALRLAGERRARLSMLRLLAVVSMLRTALTQVMPLAGSASWWVIPACLLPGVAVYLLLVAVLKAADTRTLADAVRLCLGRWGTWLLWGTVNGTLLVEGTASMTALITFFTEGIGTRGTQMTLAVLTSGVLLFCLSREGLPRGISLMRWLMLLAAAVVGLNSLMTARLDHAFPWLGDGRLSVVAALREGSGMGWPLLLLLLSEPLQEDRQARGALPALLWPVAAMAVLCLSRPHELLIAAQDLSGAMLQPLAGLHPAVITLGQCLWMLVLFLAIGAAVHVLSDQMAAPMGQPPAWLPYAVVAVLTLTQCVNIRTLWQLIMACQPWLLLPYGLLALIMAIFTKCRRSGR